jgi:hypothetical protein
MLLEAYTSQLPRRPSLGQHILAHYDDASIIVYQAYRPEIADYAIAHQAFGGAFSFGRMSWIKPNFLWMMYRSGWGTKEGQERTLALRLRRPSLMACLARPWPQAMIRHRTVRLRPGAPPSKHPRYASNGTLITIPSADRSPGAPSSSGCAGPR